MASPAITWRRGDDKPQRASGYRADCPSFRDRVCRSHAYTDTNTATPNFAPDKTGYYIARLEAFDGFASGFANTLVTAA